MSEEEITLLVRRIRAGRDEEAAQRLWDVYFDRLIVIARNTLGSLPRATTDEEDLALSGLKSFFEAAENGRLNSIEDRNGLWRLLITITIRKGNRYKERLAAKKRGGATPDTPEERVRDQQLLDGIPDQRFVTELATECRDLINALPEDTLREIATARMEGYTVDEIAAERGIAVSTVKRKLTRIRNLWADQMPDMSLQTESS